MIKTVVCGTYRRDINGLKNLILELETCGVRVLSPLSVDFTATDSSFKRAQSDENLSIALLEEFHLRAVRESDFVWLHAPEGYVGLSGSFEIGYARAMHIPIFSLQKVTDEMICTQVQLYPSVFQALYSNGLIK